MLMEEAEAEVAEILIGLRELVSAASESARRRTLLRWGHKRRRSSNNRSYCIPKEGMGKERLSPATPLSFCPSGGDDTSMTSTTTKMSRHKQWLKEQNQWIHSLISTKSNLQKSVEEAKRRYQMLNERNSWLKKLQAETEMKQQRLALDLNRSAAAEEEAMLAWQRRMLLSAQARKRRMFLQRAKFSSSPSPSPSPSLMIGDIF